MKIAMWGPKSSGKTTYIAMIYGIGLLSSSKWSVRPKDIASTNFVREKINNIRRGEFPGPTQPSPEPIYYQYEIRVRNETKSKDDDKELMEIVVDFFKGMDLKSQNPTSTSEEVVVSFADVAGEQYVQESLDHDLWNHLANSNGLICLIDPSDDSDFFDITFQLMQNLVMKMEQLQNKLINGYLPHYVAFCFSKIDNPEFSNYINKPKELMELLETRTGINIDKLISPFILPQRLKYFTVSAVGAEANVRSGRIQSPRTVKPVNLLEPLSWLFQSAGL